MNKLPSKFQIGDLVSIRFRPYLVIDSAEVIQVHFTISKVFYDLEIRLPIDVVDEKSDAFTTTRFYRIDAALVEPA